MVTGCGRSRAPTSVSAFKMVVDPSTEAHLALTGEIEEAWLWNGSGTATTGIEALPLDTVNSVATGNG